MSRSASVILSVLFVLCVASPAIAADKVKIVLAPKVGDSHKYKYVLSGKLGDKDFEATCDIAGSISKVDKDVASVNLKWQSVSLLVAGSPMAANYEDSNYDLKSTGELLKAEGGIRGADPVRSVLLLIFVPPTGEIGEGEKYTVDFKENTAEAIPARKFEGTYVGKVDYKGSSVLKFTAKYTELGDDGMTANVTYLMKEDGDILKVEADYKSLPIPMIQQVADGKAVLEAQ